MAKKTSRIRWSFQIGIGSESDKKLFNFILRPREGFGISDRCTPAKKIRIQSHNQHERFSSDSELSKGKII